MKLIDCWVLSKCKSLLRSTFVDSSFQARCGLLPVGRNGALCHYFICVLLAGIFFGARAQGFSLPPDHFMAKSLADSAHVYQHRLAARRSSAERDWVLAIGQWDQLLTYWPDDIEALTSKARIISVELSQPDDAFVIYEIAAKYAPWNVEARYGLCETKSKTDRYYEGIRACEDVLELKKNHIGALRGIAGLLARAGQVKSSEDVYKRLIEQLDTREQLDEVLADLKGHPETAVSGSNAPLRLVPILRAFWESDTLSLQRQDRIKLQEIISQRLDPVVEAALSGVANNTGNVDSVELEIQGLAHLGGDERALADLMVQLSRGGALFVKEGLNQGVLAHLRSLESRVPEQLGRSHPFNKTALQFRVLSVLNGNRGEQARSDGRDALLKLARLAYGPHSLEMQQALSTAAVLSQFDGNTRGRLVALAESQAILEGVMGPGSEQAASLLGKLISSVDDVGDRPSLEPLLLRYVDLARVLYGETSAESIRARLRLGYFLIEVERFNDALTLLMNVQKSLSGISEPSPALLASTQKALNTVLRRLGKAIDDDATDAIDATSSDLFKNEVPAVVQSAMQSSAEGFRLVDEAVRLSRAGSINRGIEAFDAAKVRLGRIFGVDHYMVAMLDILASGFEFASGRPNSSLARTTVLLGRAGYSGRAPDQVTVKTLFLRWSAAFELERWQDVHETSADYWIFLSLRNPYSTSHAESMMMLAMDAKVYGKSSAAIFLGKAAVNAIQEKRAGITELQADIQKSFLKKYSKMYQFVANVLIERGRVIEAEQVLQMLKELELRELTPRSKVGSSVQLTRVDLGGAEQRAYAQMESLVTEGARLQSELARIRIRIELLQGDEAENRQRVTELEAKLQAWEAAMRAFLDNLPKELPEVQAAGGEQENEKAKGRLQAVVQRDPTAVGLQFVVTEERLGILMASREGTVGRFSPITRVELSQRVSQLRTAILNKADTREAAEALWKALLGPVEADLQRLGARTLLLASTDVLRYLPFAALQDEQGHYLIERFALANWLAAAPDPKPRVQTQPWRMAALGVTQAKPGFPALPGVRREIQGIVRSPINPGGALPGYAHLDDEFDLQHLDEAIGGAGNIVHVASHFDFRPGDERRSVLVVGRGDPVSMASLARRDFSKVEQLTLSACETATGGGFNETGAEVEGLAALLLVKQARSVMGTLWKVADASTAQLMVSYYRQMQSGLAGQAGPLPGRAAALRAAQLQLLKGQGASVTDKLARGARPLAAGTPSPSAPSPGNPWAHPYYWAPFVISGDWM